MLPSSRDVWRFVGERGIRPVADHVCPHIAPCYRKCGRSCTCFQCLQAIVSMLHGSSYNWGGIAHECDCRREADFNQLTPCCMSDDVRCAGAGLLVCTRCRSLFGDTGLAIPQCVSMQMGNTHTINQEPPGSSTAGLGQGGLRSRQEQGGIISESPNAQGGDDDISGIIQPGQTLPCGGPPSTPQEVQLPPQTITPDTSNPQVSDILPTIPQNVDILTESVGFSEPSAGESNSIGDGSARDGFDPGSRLENPYKTTTELLSPHWTQAVANGCLKSAAVVARGILGLPLPMVVKRKEPSPPAISNKANTKFREAYHGNAYRLTKPGPDSTERDRLVWSLYCHLAFEMVGRRVDADSTQYLKRKAESWVHRQKADDVVILPEIFMEIFIEASAAALAPSGFDKAWEQFMRAEGDLGIARLNLLRDGVKVQDFRWWERPLIPNWLRTTFPRWVEEKRQVRTKRVIPSAR